ncbi:unnamed protein product [Sphagnum balticum]
MYGKFREGTIRAYQGQDTNGRFSGEAQRGTTLLTGSYTHRTDVSPTPSVESSHWTVNPSPESSSGAVGRYLSTVKELRDNELEGTNLFTNSLKHINEYLQQVREQAGVKQDDFDCSTIVFKGQTRTIKLIVSEDSRFFKTKNRAPLLLNLEFGRFIFKVDTLLQNEMVAREVTYFLSMTLPFVRFVSFSVVPLPEGGAFYEFIEHANTVSEVKKKFDGSLKLYYKAWNDEQHYLRAFSQSLVGFAIQQYVLQLKDRHN